MGHLTSLELSNGATLAVGDLLITNDFLEHGDAQIEPDPWEVEEITFDSDAEPSGQVGIHFSHWSGAGDGIGIDEQQIVEWMNDGKAAIGTPE
jgi:hypothetical protein